MPEPQNPAIQEGATQAASPQEVLVVLPARLTSTRLPRKLLLDLHGKTVLQRSYEATLKAVEHLQAKKGSHARSPYNFAPTVVISSSDREILDVAESFGAQVHQSGRCDSGTERCHQVSQDRVSENNSHAPIIVNVQADEPFLPPDALTSLLWPFDQDPTCSDRVSTLFCWDSAEACQDLSVVTLVTNYHGRCLYFSREVIPHVPSHKPHTPVKRHVGVYAYTKGALDRYMLDRYMDRWRIIDAEPFANPMGFENLEQLGFIYHNVPVHACSIEGPPPLGINTPEEYYKALEIQRLRMAETGHE